MVRVLMDLSYTLTGLMILSVAIVATRTLGILYRLLRGKHRKTLLVIILFALYTQIEAGTRAINFSQHR